jgi:uncharacterized protein YkwD
MNKLTLSALLFGAALGANRFARTQTVAEVTALSDYRAALDQISAGQPQRARLTLETGWQRGEIAPENATLLAYLEEKAGDTPRARRALEGVAQPSQLVTAYLARLDALPAAIPLGSGQSNPALLEASDARISKLEKLMWQIVNNERKNRNLGPLAWSGELASVARAHSAEMRDKKYFAHESPTPGLREPLDRHIAGIGTTPRLVAENIYRAWGSRSSLHEAGIREAHKSLMNSPGHRSNILLDGATRLGIGIAANGNGDIWVTQMFSRP